MPSVHYLLFAHSSRMAQDWRSCPGRMRWRTGSALARGELPLVVVSHGYACPEAIGQMFFSRGLVPQRYFLVKRSTTVIVAEKKVILCIVSRGR